jgi:hypothetical protein
MKQFQKIAIGLLGLTNPEMFIPRPKAGTAAAPKISPSAPMGWGARTIRALKLMITARPVL